MFILFSHSVLQIVLLNIIKEKQRLKLELELKLILLIA